MVNIPEDGDSIIRTELPIELSAMNGETVSATLLAIEFKPDETSPSCVITLRLDGAQAQRAADNEWFHLFPAMTRGTADFEPDSPAELRAALRPGLARNIQELGGDAETVLTAFLPRDSEPSPLAGMGLRQTESWIALGLMQQVELPPALQDSGVLKQGLRTDWGDVLGIGGIVASSRRKDGSSASQGSSAADAGQAEDSDEAELLADQVGLVLAEKELKYEKLDDRLLRLHFNSRRGNWVTLIRLEPDDGLYIFYSVFPELVPEPLRQTMAMQLMSENYDMLHGSFEMDEEDGELRFRTAHYYGDKFDTDIFSALLAEHLMIMEHYLPIVGHMLN